MKTYVMGTQWFWFKKHPIWRYECSVHQDLHCLLVFTSVGNRPEFHSRSLVL